MMSRLSSDIYSQKLLHQLRCRNISEVGEEIDGLYGDKDQLESVIRAAHPMKQKGKAIIRVKSSQAACKCPQHEIRKSPGV